MSSPAQPAISERCIRQDGTGVLSYTGDQLEPFGAARFVELTGKFACKALQFRDEGAHRIFCDAMPSLGVCRAALIGARTAQLPITVCVTLAENGRALYGSDPTALLETLQMLGAAAFGFSADSDPGAALIMLHTLTTYARVPLLQFPATPEKMDIFYAPTILTPPTGLLATCDYGVFSLGEAFEFSDPLSCAWEMSSEILEAENSGRSVLLVRVDTVDDAHHFARNAHMARMPVAFVGDNEEALEMALALFNGRALVDLRSDLDRGALARLAESYGATPV